MFKLTKGGSGLRRASPTGQTGRVHGMTSIRGAQHPMRRHRGAFLPDEPEEQAFDSKSSRLQGLEKKVSGGGNS